MRGLFLMLALAGLATPLAAQDPAAIVAAKRAGQIGERYDGYLGLVVVQPSDELRRQVAAINIRRRALYSDLALRKGTSPEDVGITAGCALLRRIATNEFYLLVDGQWRRLPADSAIPIPAYCG